MIFQTATFWTFLILFIPSLACSLFALYHLLFDRALCHAVNNRVIIVVLIIGSIILVTDFPWTLYYYHSNGIWERSLVFCEIWGFIDWGLYNTQTILVTWASIERHILIFHDKWIATKKKRIFVHYLPLTFLLLGCLSYYSFGYFFAPCQNEIDYNLVTCAFICLSENPIFGFFERIVAEIVPVFLIAIFSIALLLHALWQKYRMRQPIQWRRQRKMVIQLLSISSLYLMLDLPFTAMRLIIYCGYSIENIAEISGYAAFLSYFITLLMPFYCILSLNELRVKLFQILRIRRQARLIGPAPAAIRNPVNNPVHVK